MKPLTQVISTQINGHHVLIKPDSKNGVCVNFDSEFNRFNSWDDLILYLGSNCILPLIDEPQKKKPDICDKGEGGKDCLEKSCPKLHPGKKRLCRHGENCMVEKCKHLHPQQIDCKFGLGCQRRKTCPFRH